MEMRRKRVVRGLVTVVALLLAGDAAAQTKTVVVFDAAVPAIRFAAGDVQAALRAKGVDVHTAAPDRLSTQSARAQIVITTADTSLAGQPSISGLTTQGYAIRKVNVGTSSRWWAIGADAPGAMYGGLELAEAIQIDGSLSGVSDRQVNPDVLRRGIKFNIPLDARTPSYSDDSTSAQANIPEMWSMDFWTAFLDDCARHRYNLLSLWSLSPFPSLVRVPEYPNVALSDVKRKSGALWDATLQGRRMFDSTWPLETVKVMTVDQKIAFWRDVMEYARDRGVDVALFTWNTFVYGTEGSGYGISDSLDNPATRDYVRKSVRTLFNTYPLLTAVGVTSGENMGDESSGTAVKEQWLWDTYGLGVRDAMEDARNPAGPYYRPGRVIRLIHRAHQSNLRDIVSLFRQLPGYDDPDSTLSFSFKYSQAHMYASTQPLFIHQNGWFDTIPPGKKTWLTVRNDDMYYLRWGDPDFVRAYLTSLPDRTKIAGFYMGPDGYTWGREFLSTEPDTPRQLVMSKMWYSFLLWGRLAYEPSLPNAHFQRILGARFPETSAGDLFAGWASVSKILPLMTRFYWGSLDFMWNPEACWSNTGFATVQNLIDPKYRPMSAAQDGQSPRLMSVKAFVDGEAPDSRLTPLAVADLLARHADAGLQSVARLSPGTNKELRHTLGDIRAMAWLGRYYAEKIRGAVDLYRYQKGGDSRDHQNARVHLQTASSHWREYAAIWSQQYVPQVLTRMGLTPVDIRAIQTFVDRDIPAPLPSRSPRGRQPNIILIITDDQGYGDLRVHGNPKLDTPHIDRLAREGVQFQSFYVSPVCSPTRASLLTGRYNYRTGVVDTFLGRSLMHPDETTLAEVLSQAGYRTGIFGKWHLGDNYPLRAMDRGFQESLVLNGGGIGQPSDPVGGTSYFDPLLRRNGTWTKTRGYVSDVITDAAIAFITTNQRKPFFTYLAFNAPHTPLEVPAEKYAKYKGMNLKAEDFAGPGAPIAGNFDPDVTAKIYGMVENIDDNVGRLLAALDALKLTDQTVVMFMTDNGPQQPRYNAGMPRLKGTVHEGGIRAPLFVRWPGVFQPRTVDRIAAHIDVMPTLLEVTGVAKLPAVKFDGVSLGPLLRGEGSGWPDRTLFFQWHRGDTPELHRAFAARSQRYSVVQPLGNGANKLPPTFGFELYDMANDPLQQRNVAAEQPEIVARLANQYEAWFKDVTGGRDYSDRGVARIVIGSPRENPVRLTRQDWRGAQAAWTPTSLGHWEVDVQRAGIYDVALRFAELTKPGIISFALGSSTLQKEIPAGASSAVFNRVRLSRGAGRLESWVTRDDRRIGMLDVTVTRRR